MLRKRIPQRKRTARNNGNAEQIYIKAGCRCVFYDSGAVRFVLVVGNLVKEVMGDLAAGRMSIGFFLQIVALIIPGVIPYALPLGMLTGILLVFGRMSAQSEVVAIKACGRSIYTMAAPVFFLRFARRFFCGDKFLLCSSSG